MRERRKSEMTGNRRADVGEARPLSDGRGVSRPTDEHRNLFAGVVASPPSRITTMIRGNDHQIVGLQSAQQLGKPGIECLEGRGVAGHVAPMTIDRVEVDEVGEQQTSVWKLIPALQHAIEQCVIPIGPLVEAGSTMSKNIVDLSDRDHIAALGRGDIQNGWLRRRYRKIAPVRGSLEIVAARTDEGPGDNATDIEGIDQPAGDRADLVKPL